MGVSIRQATRIGYGVAIGLTLAVAVEAYRSASRAIDDAGWVAHTHAAESALKTVLQALTDAETGRRGFALTGDERFLDPYNRAVERVEQDLQRLRSLTADNPRQQARLEALEPLVSERLSLLVRAISEQRAGGLADAEQRRLTGSGMDIMHRLRAVFDEMEAEERGLLEERRAAAMASARFSRRVIVAGSSAAVVLAACAGFLVSREIGLRGQAEAALLARAEELERSKQSLDKQNAILESVLNSMADGVAVADENQRFILFNAAAERIIGYGPVDGPPDQWGATYGVFLPDRVTPFPADQYPLVRAARGEASDNVEQFILNPRVPEGVFISVTARPLRDRTEAVRGGVAVFRDVTAEKRAGEEIRKLNGEQEQRVRELSALTDELEAFSYSVSHDLRAPLRHIDGYADLMRKRAAPALRDDEKSARYLALISRAAKQMGNLIDDLLAFSRMGRTELLAGRVDLAELAEEVVAEISQGTEGREIVWKQSHLPVVIGDRAMLRIVLANLLANAVKYTRPRQPATIEIGSRTDTSAETVVYVGDNGVGFDMQYAQKLFGVFQRLHRADEFEGTGIGLATVRRIVHRHGGRVWAESTLDAGASFYFALPRAEET